MILITIVDKLLRNTIKPKTMIFIDGANLHYGTKEFKIKLNEDWSLDLLALIKKVNDKRLLGSVYYFISMPRKPSAKKIKYRDFLKKNGIRVIEIPLHYPPKRKAREKGLDVALATRLIVKALEGKFDTGIIISGDKDYIYAVKECRKRGLKIEVTSFQSRLSLDLKKVCDKIWVIDDFYDEVNQKKQPQS